LTRYAKFVEADYLIQFSEEKEFSNLYKNLFISGLERRIIVVCSIKQEE